MGSAPLTLSVEFTGLGKTCMQEWRQNENLNISGSKPTYPGCLWGDADLGREDRREVGIVLLGARELEAPMGQQLKMSSK